MYLIFKHSNTLLEVSTQMAGEPTMQWLCESGFSAYRIDDSLYFCYIRTEGPHVEGQLE